MKYSENRWVEWLDKLAEDDYVIADDFISDELYSRIMNFFRSAEENNRLKKAGIGTSGEFQIQPDIRGDFIYWLDRERDTELKEFFDLVDKLISNLKRFCFLSLSGAEFHIAKYPAGTFYHRHLDQFNKRTTRKITVLLYLNEDWRKGDGGELIIYRDHREIVVEPVAKRLLLFKSDMVEHEVLTTNVPRYSLTGWLLDKPESVGYLFR